MTVLQQLSILAQPSTRTVGWGSVPLFVALVLSSTCSFGQEMPSGIRGFTEPIQSIKVAAKESGPVNEVLVKRGDTVQTGQLMIRLDDTVLQKTRDRSFEEANNSAGVEAAEIERDKSKRLFDSLAALYRNGNGSPEEAATARADYLIALKRVETAEKDMRVAKFALSEVEAQISQRMVKSPIPGLVVDVRKKPGEFVASNDLHVITVVRLDTLRAVFFVPTQFAMKLENAESATISLPLHRAAVRAKIEYVAPVTEPDSELVRVQLLIDNTQRKYRSGIQCFLMTGQPDQVAMPATRTGQNRGTPRSRGKL